jgi:hypothetical protein
MIHAVLRTYNNEAVFRLIRELGAIEEISDIYVVINQKEDKIETARRVGEITLKQKIRCVSLTDYGWSKALNAAIGKIAENRFPTDFLLCVSNEVRAAQEHVKNLLSAARLPASSCGYALFADVNKPSFSIPRNTFCIWKLAIFKKIGLFDERLDRCGGMEDFDFSLRAYQELGLIPVLGAKRVRIDLPPKNVFEKKAKSESAAMSMILKRYPEALVQQFMQKL